MKSGFMGGKNTQLARECTVANNLIYMSICICFVLDIFHTRNMNYIRLVNSRQDSITSIYMSQS